MRVVNPEKHQQKREQLLTAARHCFAESGFQGTSIASICTAAGISPGHLYHYFSGKEEILGAIASQVLEQATETFTTALDESDLFTALMTYLDGIFQRSLNGGYRLYFDLFAEAGRNKEIASILETQSRGMHSLLSTALEQSQQRGEIKTDLDISLTASALLSLIDGSKTLYLRNPADNGKAIIQVLHQMMVGYLCDGSQFKITLS